MVTNFLEWVFRVSQGGKKTKKSEEEEQQQEGGEATKMDVVKYSHKYCLFILYFYRDAGLGN
jgi:hypothetical protein